MTLYAFRNNTRKPLNKAKSINDWEAYRDSLRAKRTSWRNLCQEIKELTEAAGLHKALAKTPAIKIGLMESPDMTYTQYRRQTLSVMLQSHFLGAVLLEIGHTLITLYIFCKPCLTEE